MRNLFLAYLLIKAVYTACDRSCFLGNDLYSAPLDINSCCVYSYKKNCENFSQITEGGFICVRCKLGFKFDNNDCVPYKKDEVCINPSIITVPFYPCKICRVNGNDIRVPQINKAKKTYECVKVDKNKDKTSAMRLANCKASTYTEGAVYCYECNDDHAFDFTNRICKKVTKKTSLKGCMMAYDSLHCLVCHSNFQLDYTKSICILRSTKIDIEGYMKKLKLEGEKQIKAMQSGNMQGGMQNRLTMDMQTNGAGNGFGGPTQNYQQGYGSMNGLGGQGIEMNQMTGGFGGQTQGMGNMNMQNGMMNGGYGRYRRI